MKKVLLSVLAICFVAFAATAQNKGSRILRLGVDKDTSDYIIASPFDNWFLGVNGGIQTFKGNEIEKEARQNGIGGIITVDFGKWVLPDVAVYLNASWMTIDGQSRYGKQPFINFLNPPITDGSTNGYQPFHAHAAALMGQVALDWTTFVRGYEKGMQRHFHVITPIGLGASVLYGKQENPRSAGEVGDLRGNFELCYSAALQFEYITRTRFAFDLTARLMGSESTWDWSPYDNSYSRFDIIPELTAGLKYNMIKEVRLNRMYGKDTTKMVLNNVFFPATIIDLTRLSNQMDSIREVLDNVSASLMDDNGMMVPANEGIHLNSQGQLVDKDGNPVAEGVHLDNNGDLVDANGNHLDKDGNLIADNVHLDDNGQLVDKNGKPVSGGVRRVPESQLYNYYGHPVEGLIRLAQDGQLVDKNGNPIKDGTHINNDGYLVDANGMFLTEDGKPLAECVRRTPDGTLVDQNGNPKAMSLRMNQYGQLVDQNGKQLPEGTHFNKDGYLVDAYGRLVDQNGTLVPNGVTRLRDNDLVDMFGRPVAGNLSVDADGNIVDKNGYVLNNGTHFNDEGYLVDGNGRYVDANGNLIGGNVHLYSPDRSYQQQQLDAIQQQVDSLTHLNKDLMVDILGVADRNNLPSLIVYYELDKYNIDANARVKIDEFAKAIKNGDQDKVYYLIGAADAATGSINRNIFLGKARAKAVYDILVKEYDINPARLKMFPLGGITEYEPKEMNRVCIVVEANNELTKLIDKYSVKE